MRCVCGPCPTRDCGVHAAVHFLPQPPPGAPCPRPRPMYDAHAPSLQRSAHLAARRAHPATLTSSACRVSLPRCHAAAMPVPHCSPLPRRHPAAIRCCPCHAAMPTVALASAAATAPSGAARRSGDAVLLTGDTPHELRSSRTPALTPPCRSPLHRVLTRLPRRVKHRAACRTAGLASARRRDAPRHTARHAARCCAKSRRKPPAVLCKGSRWHERPSWARCTDLRESDRALKPPAAVHLMLAGVHPTDETSGRAGLRRTAPQCWRKCERLTCVCRASARAA